MRPCHEYLNISGHSQSCAYCHWTLGNSIMIMLHDEEDAMDQWSIPTFDSMPGFYNRVTHTTELIFIVMQLTSIAN